ncbi:helix-turn-helix domain-containing protein [Anabaenopsis elenkinii]|uniref:Helix-turn-helix domain-containing protein n=1 Tax=Anabaenopsis elenkinii CCIBt3563 TaxID=2779889 RepID=A0A7U3NMZ4_9CYAN|nr:helix-turn-helix domain-containing protein [Anabaenopsis elenkinii]QOV21859.1 helix-turn-helix domain-containing protein [Anabaenopsis elenkinii CCIBt3563]
MNIEEFIQSAQALDSCLADLYQTASVLPWIPPEMLPQAVKEIYSTSKIVRLAAEELYQEHEKIIQTNKSLEAERQGYQDLFDFAPEAYLVTNTAGVIEKANLAAAKLLNISKPLLVGQAIVNFLPPEERQIFGCEIRQLYHSARVAEFILRLQQRQGEYFDAALKVSAVTNPEGKVNFLFWLLRNITQGEKQKTEALNCDCDLIHHRTVYKYLKGETIPLNPLVVWYVRRGLVKLNTFCETGEEIFIGLAIKDMVFGSHMTSLPIYQAIALSNVELSSIYVAEIAANPNLSHLLLPKFNQRLQQTESFLVIAGKRRVEERLYHLLQLLKQEIGEPVPQGTRLPVRLTHEEIASACCTTRVTITRLMGKLQQQGLISFDSKKYIILGD